MPGTARNRRTRQNAGLVSRRLSAAVIVGFVWTVPVGCAVGLTPAGKPVIGLAVGSEGQLVEPDAVVDGIETAAGFLPPPWDTIVKGGGLLLAGGAFGRERGRHVGWSERDEAALPKPATAPLPGGGQA